MHACHLTSPILLLIALIAANLLMAQHDVDQVCLCTSPTGCPGQCSGNLECVNYYGMNTVVCNACSMMSLGCILDFDNGSCFTGEFL
jgi:hypothetical protein